MRRFVSFALGLCSALVFGACPGELTNPEDFGDGGVPINDAETILAETCGTMGCHDASVQAPEGLDLLSPNVESRVVDANAMGIGCTDEILVVAGDPDASYLLDKILNTPGICGARMPVLGSLTSEEIDTIRQWIIDLGGSADGTPDGG
ncbi:MAG: hypothetical protein AMJ62_12850 [Myxococcales bacterium SG8_38]|nr:MAG: hypothetical protein AMJ62_12850 [Myxococcales bacterium SG8_38]